MKRERKELLLSIWYIIRLAGWYSIRLAIAIYSYFYNKDIIRKNIVYFNYNEQYIWGIKGVKLYKIITALFF